MKEQRSSWGCTGAALTYVYVNARVLARSSAGHSKPTTYCHPVCFGAQRRNVSPPAAQRAGKDRQWQPIFITDHGYTGHEHWDAYGLINMNGRVYDPVLGRFMSPDPYIQDAGNAQNFDRYSYVLNNPLKYTDPSGYANDLSWADIQARNYAWGASYTNTPYGWINTYFYEDFMNSINSSDFDVRNGKEGYWVADYQWDYRIIKSRLIHAAQKDIAWTNNYSSFNVSATFISFENALGIYADNLYALRFSFGRNSDYFNFDISENVVDAEGRDALYWTGVGISVAGTYPFFKERSYVKNGKWKSTTNGKWYDIDKRPNGITGPKRPAISNASYYNKIGKGLFWTNTILSGAQGLYDLREGDYNGAMKAGLDIGMGYVSTLGPIGFGIGMSYMLFDVFFLSPDSHFAIKPNPLVNPTDHTYVAP